MAAYEEKLSQFIHRTGMIMKPVYERARSDLKRVVYAEGEEFTVLRAVQVVIDEGLARPILDRSPGSDRAPHRPTPACACAPARISSCATSTMIRASANTGAITTPAMPAMASPRMQPRTRCVRARRWSRR